MKSRDTVKFMGMKLLYTQLSIVKGDGLRVFRSLSKPKLLQRVSSGLFVYDNVLWMRMIEIDKGMRLPNGARYFAYTPFWKPKERKRIYKFQMKDGKTYEYHSF